MPQSVSIKEAMGALGGKLVTGGVPKPGNKDDPDSDQPEKPKIQAEVIVPITEAIK
ncbi:DNA methylase [Bacteroides ovatus]|nr:DNA methylase [Bacteroides ovatus]